ncbi:phosphatase PAP2 family protein [Geodermatophilus sp. SYSU D01106]
MSPLTYLAALLLCVVFAWVFSAWRASGAALLAAVLAVAAADFAKHLVERPRPPADLALVASDGLAMPSSIAAMTSAAALPVAVVCLRMTTGVGRVIAATLLAATVGTGLAMVYLGAHWLSDVLVGWLLGGAVGIVVLALVNWIRLPRRSATG